MTTLKRKPYRQHLFCATVLFFTLFYYPLVLKYLSGSVYQVLSVVFLGISLLLAVDRLSKEKIVSKLLLSYIAVMIFYFLFQASSTVFLGNDLYSALGDVVRYLVFICLLLSLSYEDVEYTDRVLCSAAVMLSVLALIGFVVSVLGNDGRVSEIKIDTAQYMDDGSRGLAWYGFQWMRLPAIGEHVYRLQSFSSEAGNFALLIGVAFLNSIKNKKRISTLILMTCFVLTFSISAWASLLVTCLVLYRNKIGLYAVLILFSMVFSFLIYQEVGAFAFFNDYLSTKFSTSDVGDSSLDQRLGQLNYFFESGKECVLYGCGFNASRSLNITIAIGWLVPLVSAGIYFSLFYFSFYIMLLFRSIRVLLKSKVSDEEGYYLSVFLFIVLMGFFRTEPFSSPWYAIYIAGVILVIQKKVGFTNRAKNLAPE